MNDINNDNILADNLHRLMSDARLTASELGRHLDLPAATIKKLRTGENKNPTISTLSPIAKHFGINISQLIGEEPLINNNTHAKFDNNLSYNSDMFTNVVPLINWDETLTWNETQNNIINRKLIHVGQSVDKQSYALLLHTNYSVFKKDGVVIIEPALTNNTNSTNCTNNTHHKSNLHDNYALIHKIGQSTPNIKRIISEDGNFYMQSLIPGINSTQKLTDAYTILAHIVAYKQWFKTP